MMTHKDRVEQSMGNFRIALISAKIALAEVDLQSYTDLQDDWDDALNVAAADLNNATGIIRTALEVLKDGA